MAPSKFPLGLPILLGLVSILAQPLHAVDTLLSDDFSSGSVGNATLNLSTVGTWRGNTTSKSITGGQLQIVSASTYNGVEEGIVGQNFQITSQTGTTISVSFDYSVVSSSTMYVHFRGVDSSTTAWSQNTGAQNGAVWDTNTGGATYRLYDGTDITGNTALQNTNSAIASLTGSGSYSTDIDISGYTLSDVSSYDYLMFGFAFNFGANGTSWVDNVLLQSYTPAAAAIWDGGGGDTNINTAANWDGDSTPTLTGGTEHLQFGTGGSSVTVNTATNVDKITINRGADFTIASGGNLTVGAGGIVISSSGGQSHTITGGVTLAADQTVNVATGEALTVSGGLGGSYGFTKDGGGSLTLTGNNTFTGDLVLFSGSTNLEGGGRLGGGNFTGNISVSSTLTFNGTNDQTISGSISGGSTIVKYGSTTLTLSANNTMTGAITLGNSGGNLTAGTIRLEHANALGSKYLNWENDGTIELGVNGVTISNGATIANRSSATDGKRRYRLDLAGSNTGTISGNFDIRMAGTRFDVGTDDTLTLSGSVYNGAGAGSWTKEGAGTLVITGSHTASGTTTISAGTVQVGSGGTTGSLNSSALTNNGVLVFNRSNALTVSNAISGTGAVTQNGSGTVTLTGTSTYTGATTINAGTLEIGGTGKLGSGSYSGAIANAGTFTYNSTSAQTLSGVISGSGNLVKSNSGTLTLSGTNTYSGGTTLNAGTLVIGNAAAAGTGNITQTDGSSLLKFDTTGTVQSGLHVYNVGTTQTITIGGDITAYNTTWDVADGTTTSLNGTISGSGGITKDGNGTLAVNGANNTFTGDTVVNDGILEANAVGALGATGNITMHNGGSILVKANNAINDSATVTMNGGTLDFDGNITEYVGALTLSANSTIDMGGGNIALHFSDLLAGLTNTTRLNIYNYTLYSDHLYFTNNANVSDSLQYISFYSGWGTGLIGNSFISSSFSPWQVQPVPEPETWATAAILLVGGGTWLLRRKKAGNGLGLNLLR
jgi:fibronectin-binding autotransporter adhesin